MPRKSNKSTCAMTKQAPEGTPVPSTFTYTILPEPSDDYIPYPPQIKESRKADFRNLFIEHTRIINLKLQMKNHVERFRPPTQKRVISDAALAYRSFQVVPNAWGQRSLNSLNGKVWFKDRLKWISDQIMNFTEDVAWRERIQKQGKKGRFVLYGEGDGKEA